MCGQYRAMTKSSSGCVGHPSWDCSHANSLNFRVSIEPEASEFSKGLLLAYMDGVTMSLMTNDYGWPVAWLSPNHRPLSTKQSPLNMERKSSYDKKSHGELSVGGVPSNHREMLRTFPDFLNILSIRLEQLLPQIPLKKILTMTSHRRKRFIGFHLGEGVMPTIFKVLDDPVRNSETLIADFGESAVGRVAPVYS
ncbi:hypothetical protein DVH24_034486 [Malus domestica]|uniref:Alkaline/neutral invertase n=1 Tax=Malus domestica TaxID=3750 RepID=A0A498IWL4_MALDO|nr:hypothetical protein DVH24_034486 [Malus domestica]